MCECNNCNREDMAAAVGLFITQCGEIAEKNWTPQQVQQLEWLFGAVLTGVEYADYAEQQLKEVEE